MQNESIIIIIPFFNLIVSYSIDFKLLYEIIIIIFWPKIFMRWSEVLIQVYALTDMMMMKTYFY